MLRKHFKNTAILIILLIITMSAAIYFFLEQPFTNLQPPPPKYNIHVIFKAYKAAPDFWRIVEQGVEVAQQEFNVSCFVTGPKDESAVEQQMEIMRASIAEKPDAIILAASDFNLMAPLCKEAVDKGIQLIMVDSDVNFSGNASIIATNNYEIGANLASLVTEYLPDSAKVGAIGHVENVSTAALRHQGFIENLSNVDGRYVGIEYCEGSVEKAKVLALEMIRNNPDLQCLVGLNETSSSGIAYALRESGKAGKIMLFSCDSSEQLIPFMENGTVEAFVVQNPFNMGYLSIEAAVNVLDGKKVEAEIFTPTTIITKENMYKPENQKLLFPFNESTPKPMEVVSGKLSLVKRSLELYL